MAQDEYGIYRKPTGSVIAAWLGIAAAIFFGAYAFKMKDRLQEAHNSALAAHEEAEQMKLQMISQMGEMQALKVEILALKENRTALSRANSQHKAQGNIAIMPVASVTSVPTVRIEAEPESKRNIVATKTPEPAKAPAMPSNMLQLPQDSATVLSATAPSVEESNKTAVEEAAKLSAEIVSYNPDTRKAYISLGSANGGLQPGSRFSVWRGDKYVTDIRVVKVFSVTSTCEVEGPTPIGVRSGDIAKIAGGSSGA